MPRSRADEALELAERLATTLEREQEMLSTMSEDAEALQTLLEQSGELVFERFNYPIQHGADAIRNFVSDEDHGKHVAANVKDAQELVLLMLLARSSQEVLEGA